MSSREKFERIFHRPPEVNAYAPGRIEFIGNHTDYNGGAVLGAAVDRGIWVSLASREDRAIHLTTGESGLVIETSLDSLVPQTGSDSWINYPLGVLVALIKDGMSADRGFDFAAVSNLPAGAGMSSSAALELSSACALTKMHSHPLPLEQLARIGREAENDFVGVPCGLLDQGVSAFGRADHLVHIDCLTETYSRVAMPAGAHFWIFNSNKKHALLDSKYSERHRECQEAFGILQPHCPEVPCLAHVPPETVARHAAELGPERARRAEHVTTEHRRVERTCRALQSGDLEEVGRLLTESHRSSRDLFENSVPELDFLVDQLTSLPGVLGARLTGGGFGGAVMALTSAEFGQLEQTESVSAAFRARFENAPTIFHAAAGDGARVLP